MYSFVCTYQKVDENRARIRRGNLAARSVVVAWPGQPALGVHLAGINVRIDHNNLSVLLGKSFALVGGGCTAECCCRSVARCAASSYCRSFVSRATEISRSGTLSSPRVALPLQFTLRSHPPSRRARFLSSDAPAPFARAFASDEYSLRIYHMINKRYIRSVILFHLIFRLLRR